MTLRGFLAAIVGVPILIYLAIDAKPAATSPRARAKPAAGAASATRDDAEAESQRLWERWEVEIQSAIAAEIPVSEQSTDRVQCELFRRSAREYCRRELAKADLPTAPDARHALFRRWVRRSTMRDMDLVWADVAADRERERKRRR